MGLEVRQHLLRLERLVANAQQADADLTQFSHLRVELGCRILYPHVLCVHVCACMHVCSNARAVHQVSYSRRRHQGVHAYMRACVCGCARDAMPVHCGEGGLGGRLREVTTYLTLFSYLTLSHILGGRQRAYSSRPPPPRKGPRYTRTLISSKRAIDKMNTSTVSVFCLEGRNKERSWEGGGGGRREGGGKEKRDIGTYTKTDTPRHNAHSRRVEGSGWGKRNTTRRRPGRRQRGKEAKVPSQERSRCRCWYRKQCRTMSNGPPRKSGDARHQYRPVCEMSGPDRWQAETCIRADGVQEEARPRCACVFVCWCVRACLSGEVGMEGSCR